MSTHARSTEAPGPRPARRSPRSALAASGPAHTLRAVKVVYQREMIRFVRSKGRLISGLAQPLLLLFVLGSGLSGLTRSSTGGVDFKTFLFPGIVATSTLFTAIFAGISIVWDREFGFLREMLVAPVPRTAILVGKCLGGAADRHPAGASS